MISDSAFEHIIGMVRRESGIHLGESKRQLVVSRLAKRLRHHGIHDYESYCDLCSYDDAERRILINTITTNETSFFREPHHFTFMQDAILPQAKKHFRVWSAAASIGAEGYSIAMTLAEAFAPRAIEWEVVGTDINTEVVEQANRGLFPIRFAEQIKPAYLKKFCLKGCGPQEGNFLIDDPLKQQVRFMSANLMGTLPGDLGTFDVIFLRNVLIYFDQENKRRLVRNVLERLKPGGHLFIGHSETISHFGLDVRQIRPTIYQKGA